MRLWLDDCRTPPFGYDAWAKTADECIAYLERGGVEHVSLDHDLADEHIADPCGYGESLNRASYREKTGYDVIVWMAEHNSWPSEVVVHTANPVGRADMLRLLERRAPMETTYTWRTPPVETAVDRSEGG